MYVATTVLMYADLGYDLTEAGSQTETAGAGARETEGGRTETARAGAHTHWGGAVKRHSGTHQGGGGRAG